MSNEIADKHEPQPDPWLLNALKEVQHKTTNDTREDGWAWFSVRWPANAAVVIAAHIPLPTSGRMADPRTDQESSMSEKINLKLYASPEEVFAFTFGLQVAEIEEIDSVGGCEWNGKETHCTPADVFAGMRLQKMWGFAEFGTNTVHAWIDPSADFEKVMWFFAHEVAHLTMPQGDELASEKQSELVGFVAKEAYRLAISAGGSMSNMSDKFIDKQDLQGDPQVDQALEYFRSDLKPNAQETPEVARQRWGNIIFHTKELFGGANYSLITPVLLERLGAYRDDGQPVGSFLEAVISNNLSDAISQADEYNRATLYHLIAWMYNEFPAPLWGSAEKYASWVATKKEERERTETQNGARS